MTNPTRVLAAAALSALVAGTALAAPARPPKTTDAARLRAWHKEALGNDWLYVGATASGVWSVRYGSVSWESYPIIEADVRLDKPEGDALWRMARERYDCERFRTQVLRLESHFGGSKPNSATTPPPAWTDMAEGSAGRRILDIVCEAARRNLQKESPDAPGVAPAEPAGATDKTT